MIHFATYLVPNAVRFTVTADITICLFLSSLASSVVASCWWHSQISHCSPTIQYHQLSYLDPVIFYLSHLCFLFLLLHGITLKTAARKSWSQKCKKGTTCKHIIVPPPPPNPPLLALSQVAWNSSDQDGEAGFTKSKKHLLQ